MFETAFQTLPPEPASSPGTVAIDDDLVVLTKGELATLLGVNPWTVDRWRRKSGLDFPQPIWLSGTTPRWRRAEVRSWLASRQQGGVAPDYPNRNTPKAPPQRRRLGRTAS
jgi:predicted DNA-binding transcriptional regulator AlpA